MMRCLLLGLFLVSPLMAQEIGDCPVSKVTVEFPSKPVTETRQLSTATGPLSMTGMFLKTPQSTKSFAIAYPANIDGKDLEKRYDDAKEGLLKNTSRKLILEEPFSVGGYTGRRFVVYEDGVLKTEQRIIWIDAVLHTIMVQCPWNEDLDAMSKTYFASVKLKK